MRVTFKHEEVRLGLVFKQTFQKVTVLTELTEVERQLIKQQKLEGKVVLDCVPANARDDRLDDVYYYYVRDVVAGKYVFHVNNVTQSKQFEEMVTDQLMLLKAYLEDGEVAPASKTIEL